MPLDQNLLIEDEGTGTSTSQIPTPKPSDKVAVVTAPSVGSFLRIGQGLNYGRVASALVSSNEIIVTLSVLIYDYVGESNAVKVERNVQMNLGSSYVLATSSDIALLNQDLATKNMFYNTNTGVLAYRLGTRLPAGTTYYFVNDRMTMESAVEDGLATGVHKDRFAKGNYVTSEWRTNYGNTCQWQMSVLLINSICAKTIGTGNY